MTNTFERVRYFGETPMIMSCAARLGSLAAICGAVYLAHAGIPEPDFVRYGEVRINGVSRYCSR